jgi:hypothetical protein
MLLLHRYNSYLSDDSQRFPDDPFLTQRSLLAFRTSCALPISLSIPTPWLWCCFINQPYIFQFLSDMQIFDVLFLLLVQ